MEVKEEAYIELEEAINQDPDDDDDVSGIDVKLAGPSSGRKEQQQHRVPREDELQP